MMKNKDIWFHGAQKSLEIIRKGSSITPYRNVAVAFSHRPTIVSMEEGSVLHNGTMHGYLHQIDEDLVEKDILLHPACNDGEDWEWVVQRDVRVRLIADYDVDPAFFLTSEDIVQLKRTQKES